MSVTDLASSVHVSGLPPVVFPPSPTLYIVLVLRNQENPDVAFVRKCNNTTSDPSKY